MKSRLVHLNCFNTYAFSPLWSLSSRNLPFLESKVVDNQQVSGEKKETGLRDRGTKEEFLVGENSEDKTCLECRSPWLKMDQGDESSRYSRVESSIQTP